MELLTAKEAWGITHNKRLEGYEERFLGVMRKVHESALNAEYSTSVEIKNTKGEYAIYLKERFTALGYAVRLSDGRKPTITICWISGNDDSINHVE